MIWVLRVVGLLRSSVGDFDLFVVACLKLLLLLLKGQGGQQCVCAGGL